MKRITIIVWAALALGMTAGTRAAPEAPVNPDERWYVVKFQQRHAGWMRMWIDENDERTVTGMHMHIAIRRGPTTIEMDMTSEFQETPEGKPIRTVTTQSSALESMTKTIAFTDKGRTVTTTQGDREHVRELPPIEGDWLTPAAAGRYVEKRFAAGDNEARYRSFDATMSNDAFEVTMTREGQHEIEVFGRTVKAWKTRTVNSATPNIPSFDYIDDGGELIRSTVDMGGIAIEIAAADKALATAGLDPPELMASTLVKPDFTILKPRKLRKATWVLSIPEGEMPELPGSSAQRFKRVDARTARVTVDLDAPAPVNVDEPKIVNTAMIDGADEKVIELAKEATRGVGNDKATRAEAMRRFVRRYIRQADLSVGFASAGEVARARRGDCTEHGVLLAAMCQADGIPARAASGLVYVSNFVGHRSVFGYHMWTQVWLDGRWVDLDATLDNAAFDATHILISASRLEGGAGGNEMVRLAPLLGRLQIAWDRGGEDAAK